MTAINAQRCGRVQCQLALFLRDLSGEKTMDPKSKPKPAKPGKPSAPVGKQSADPKKPSK
ncbi:hypothetical protein [Roseicyclus marinus]|uniref:hypothetical protein n=1 Tax=Roseicyclus marinus TaxID=2161673 RepID=UPI0030C76161